MRGPFVNSQEISRGIELSTLEASRPGPACAVTSATAASPGGRTLTERYPGHAGQPTRPVPGHSLAVCGCSHRLGGRRSPVAELGRPNPRHTESRGSATVTVPCLTLAAVSFPVLFLFLFHDLPLMPRTPFKVGSIQGEGNFSKIAGFFN